MIPQRDGYIRAYFNFVKRFKKVERIHKEFLSFSTPHTNTEIMKLFIRWDHLREKRILRLIEKTEKNDDNGKNI